ncbi:hypothetical protein A0H81_02296 [Grifola frondosa]|uniref:Tyr recombinase domain-containing protein n=1 Tax=Grifola frondosa TaxID=5627 RepID=A0A1C7MKK8_GRIFR|nr:hypothetical protein A0H81_02296 [Grifola frondosa]
MHAVDGMPEIVRIKPLPAAIDTSAPAAPTRGSVDSYLSGICSSLEEYYPNIRAVCSSPLVTRCVKGCKRLYSNPIRRKSPLTKDDLRLVHSALSLSHDHDDHLFLSLLLTGFHALMRLGELVWPDQSSLRLFKKLALRHHIALEAATYSFLLPSHKADPLFEGNLVIVQAVQDSPDPRSAFALYLSSRDALFPFRPELWLRASGTVPTRAWFVHRLRTFFPISANISGHSLRAGGATSLAEAGVPPTVIQSLGRWSSDAWQAYIRKHPVVLNALLFSGRALHDGPSPMH